METGWPKNSSLRALALSGQKLIGAYHKAGREFLDVIGGEFPLPFQDPAGRHLGAASHRRFFNPVEFEGFRSRAGLNSFVLTPRQWIENTAAVGIFSKAGRYGGTFAHRDIAFEFASWVSVEFKLYLIKEFQRLKEDENRRLSLAWNLNRTLAKINYRLHTDAIQTHLIPAEVTAIFAHEDDLSKVTATVDALFTLLERAFKS